MLEATQPGSNKRRAGFSSETARPFRGAIAPSNDVSDDVWQVCVAVRCGSLGDCFPHLYKHLWPIYRHQCVAPLCDSLARLWLKP